ncbi:hypothetical protein AB7M47_002769 [Bradyrhizobium elkanii]
MGPGLRRDDVGRGLVTFHPAETVHLWNPPTSFTGGISRLQISLW